MRAWSLLAICGSHLTGHGAPGQKDSVFLAPEVVFTMATTRQDSPVGRRVRASPQGWAPSHPHSSHGEGVTWVAEGPAAILTFRHRGTLENQPLSSLDLEEESPPPPAPISRPIPSSLPSKAPAPPPPPPPSSQPGPRMSRRVSHSATGASVLTQPGRRPRLFTDM